MASRISVGEVRAYAGVPTSVPNESIQLWIDQATLIIDEDLAGSGYSEPRLKAIELNLAAHFGVLSSEKGGLTYQQVGEAAERYQLGTEGVTGLSSSRFGQQVALLDTKGILAGLYSSPLKAQFKVNE